jgi:hypothetical protein
MSRIVRAPSRRAPARKTTAAVTAILSIAASATIIAAMSERRFSF